jgi:hypothetical protein
MDVASANAKVYLPSGAVVQMGADGRCRAELGETPALSGAGARAAAAAHIQRFGSRSKKVLDGPPTTTRKEHVYCIILEQGRLPNVYAVSGRDRRARR